MQYIRGLVKFFVTNLHSSPNAIAPLTYSRSTIIVKDKFLSRGSQNYYYYFYCNFYPLSIAI